MAPPSLRALIRGDIACIASRDPAARGTLEIVVTYPGLHAVVLHRIAARLWRRNWRFTARTLSWWARLVTNVDIHPGATVGERFFIDHGAGVVIGETAVVGNDVTLYHGVTLGGTSWSPGKRHPTLGDRVLVGAGAKILGPITVESGARIGANSVVIENVPPNATVVGIPGRIVRAPGERRRQEHSPTKWKRSVEERMLQVIQSGAMSCRPDDSVRSESALEGGRIDLEHHLMPDPVGEALAYLIDRVNVLEVRLAEVKAQRDPTPTPPVALPTDPALPTH